MKIFFINIILSPILGLMSILTPVIILNMNLYNAPYFPMVRTGIEEFSIFSVFLLISCGGILGYINPKYKILSGFMTVSLLPILAIVEMSTDPTSHNLWPIEFLIYILMSLPGIIGSLLGAFVKKKNKS